MVNLIKRNIMCLVYFSAIIYRVLFGQKMQVVYKKHLFELKMQEEGNLTEHINVFKLQSSISGPTLPRFNGG